MIGLRDISDDDPALAHSPMVRGVAKTFEYIEAHGNIPLTPSKAFKRVFVQWAAAAFDWPGHTEADLYAVNKVLNEQDFFPLDALHQLMLTLKIGRHYKVAFHLTKSGRQLQGRPGKIFAAFVPFWLFQVDHTSFSRFRDEAPLLGDWDLFLNVLNVETEDGATGAELRHALYGPPEAPYDDVMSKLYLEVLRPLCWAGLLTKHEGGRRYLYEDALFIKTPLWKSAFVLDTDGDVESATRH